MRRKVNYRILTLVIVVLITNLFVGGCRKTPIYMPQDPGDVKFSVASSKLPQSVGTRAKTDENNDFTTDSQIGIYATKGEETDVHLALPENTNVGYFNPTGSTQWSVIEAGKSIKFFKQGELMNFFAYHPFTGQAGTSVVMDADVTSPTLLYTLPRNQSTLQVLTVADLMWGKKFGISESQGTVNLEFEHKLTKLSFKINAGEGWANEELTLSRVEVIGAQIPHTAKMHISSGVLVPGTDVNTSVYADFVPAMNLDYRNAQQCQFIVIPSTLSGDIELQFTAKGSASEQKVYKATLLGVNLKGGHLREMTVSIHKTTSLSVTLSPTIKPWDVISDISMEAI